MMEMMKILEQDSQNLKSCWNVGRGLLGWLQKLVRFKHKIEFEGVAKDLRLHVEKNRGFGLTVHTHTL